MQTFPFLKAGSVVVIVFVVMPLCVEGVGGVLGSDVALPQHIRAMAAVMAFRVVTKVGIGPAVEIYRTFDTLKTTRRDSRPLAAELNLPLSYCLLNHG